MFLTSVTDAMIEKVLREESLVKNVKVPKAAVKSVCRAMHEAHCADWDETMDEQRAWDDLPKGSKEMSLREAAWLIGRLAHDGYVIVSRKILANIG